MASISPHFPRHHYAIWFWWRFDAARTVLALVIAPKWMRAVLLETMKEAYVEHETFD